MRKIYTNRKKGFTLLELMLAIAIILVISGLFVDLVIATHESYYTTYNRNDASDYAQLFGKMIQDQILADRQDDSFASGNKRTYYMSTSDAQFYFSGSSTPVVQMPASVLNDGSPKWKFCISNVNYVTDTSMCYVEITVIDNFHNPGDIIFTYTQSFWIPTYGDKVTVAGVDNSAVSINGGSVDNYKIEITKV